MKYFKIIILSIIIIFSVQGVFANNNQKQQNGSVVNNEDDEYKKKYKEAISELKNILMSLQSQKQSQETLKDSEKKKDEEKKIEVIVKEEKIDKNVLYSKKYDIELIKNFFEKDVEHLLVSEKSKATFFSDNTVEIYDVYEGHRRVREYIDDLEKKVLRTYFYTLEIESDKENKKKIFEGVITTIVPVKFDNGMGTIEIVPKLKDNLFVVITNTMYALNARFVMPNGGGQQYIRDNGLYVRITLRRM